jgi:hypothetical protein
MSTKINFTIKVEPFSINAVNAIGNKRLYPTPKFRNWRDRVIKALDNPDAAAQMTEFKEQIDSDKHGLYFIITHKINEKSFYTNNGAISIRSKDITNIEKPLVDIICDSKLSERKDFTNLGIDDRFIVGQHSTKQSYDCDRIDIIIYKIDLTKWDATVKRIREAIQGVLK